MRFGICIGGDAEKIAVVKKLGYDYVETSFSLLANESEAEFTEFKKELAKNNITCESVNRFLPETLKVTGDEVDYKAVTEYIERGMKRGADLGVKTVVFGSSGARNTPEGYPYDKAIRQLIFFLREICSPICAKYGLRVVIEPLSAKDTNIIHTVLEGGILISAVNKDNIGALGDLYHMYNAGDGADEIKTLKGVLWHAHIAEPTKRFYPSKSDTYDYKAFVDALEYAGCTRCSLEAGYTDFEEDAKKAIEVFKSL
ncbi:MAG: sugar phosphate isomerase/epimerase [Oscillospiraceae bacterium]|nr:sugar phosphate isomerase/epimerase [Oscillospiraceae bacterium]